MPLVEAPKKGRRELRTSSTLRLPPITDDEENAARIPLFDLLGITRLVRGLYLDAFYTTIDDEYGAFATLPFPRDEKHAVMRRVAAAIRTIAAFSSWYPLVWAFVAGGFFLANAAGVVAATIVGYVLLIARPEPSAITFAVACAALALVEAARLSLQLPRSWPYDVLTFVVVGAALATLAQIVFMLSAAWWSAGVIAAAAGVAAFCGANALVLAIAQAISQYVTRRKITAFPEEEIIQTTALVLTAFYRTGVEWRVAEERAGCAANIEWIARRIERELIAPYVSGNPGSDEQLRADAAACAAAFRARRADLAFPNAFMPEALCAFLWTALQNEAVGRWGSLERTTPAPFAAARRTRAFAVLGSVVAIGLPAAIALVVLQLKLPPDAVAFQRNLAITAFGWSVLSLLAVINPRQFEQQASAAKTLGDLLKQSRGG